MTQVHTLPPASQTWIPQLARIAACRVEGPRDVTTYDLELCDEQRAAEYRFAPGQFNMLYLPGVGEAPISISSAAHAPHSLQHTIRAVGNVTHSIARLAPGSEIGLRGPFGSAWPLAELQGRDVVLAAGGIGLAPLRPVIYEIMNERARYGQVSLLYGARQPSELLYRAEFEQWRAAGIEVYVTVDLGAPDWLGHIGVVPSLFDHLQLKASHTSLLTCGPEIMMRFVALAGLQAGIAADQIWLSMERNMNCAVGLCGHCQLGPEFICKNGPVFRYPRLVRYLTWEDL